MRHDDGVPDLDPLALGAFLKARRAARSPQDADLPAGVRRRTAGLRREELATLAGVSIQYLTRLEQGSHREPSVSVLNALATALGLTDDARAHLFMLAGRPDPRALNPARQDVTPTLLRMLERAEPNPAAIINRRRDFVTHNFAMEALLGGLRSFADSTPNYLRLLFCEPAARELWVDWQQNAQDAVAHFRQATAATRDLTEVTELVDELNDLAPDFAAIWQRQDVRCTCTPTTNFAHPGAGRVSFTVEALDADGGDLQLVIYEPATARANDRWIKYLRALPSRTALRVV